MRNVRFAYGHAHAVKMAALVRSLCRAPQVFRAASILSDSSTSGGKAVESLVPARSLFGYGGRSQSRVLGEVDTQVFELQGQLQNSNNTESM